ncbi:MAG: hypothetical protein HFF58_04590 [Lawsonibacter sp.]|jgi:hypothetical protein|nr:hypothetical protein [Lawsonibacter sp.]
MKRKGLIVIALIFLAGAALFFSAPERRAAWNCSAPTGITLRRPLKIRKFHLFPSYS